MEVQTWIRRRWAEVGCGILLCIMAINLISIITRKTITNDEIVLIPAGYYHLAAANFQHVYEHPPLCKILSGIPLLFIQPNEARSERRGTAATASPETWDDEMTFWTDNQRQFQSISFWTRLPMIGLTISLGVLIFVFAQQLFGPLAAVLAVAVFSLEPTMLAHGRIVQTDVPAAFGLLFVIYSLHQYTGGPTLRRAIWIGVAVAIALLAKFSMMLVLPIVAVFFGLRLWRRDPRVVKHGALICLTIVVLINAAYFFRHHSLQKPEVQRIRGSFAKSAGVIVPLIKASSHIVPVEFTLGALWQVTHSSQGHTAGLLGMQRKTGWWYYFPVAFSLKTTLPFLFSSMIALTWAVWRASVKRDARFFWLLLPFFAYSLLLFFSGINIGVRYSLPGYVLLFIVTGALFSRLTNLWPHRAAGVAIPLVFLAWMTAIAMQTYPNYVPYVNELASRHPRWWYLSDSNVEWGDDVRGLAEYLKARGEKSVRAALLGGFLTLRFYQVDYVDLLSDESLPDTRYVALGASFLNGSTVSPAPHRSEEERVNRFDQFRTRSPEAVIGGSIYVYRMHD